MIKYLTVFLISIVPSMCEIERFLCDFILLRSAALVKCPPRKIKSETGFFCGGVFGAEKSVGSARKEKQFINILWKICIKKRK